MLLTAADVLNIPAKALPLMVLSDNPKSWVSSIIKWRTGGEYNHFMWMHRPGFVASQNLFFGEQPIQQYLKEHRLLFYHNPNWKQWEKVIIQSLLKTDLKAPKWQTRYDWMQIIGKALPWAEWINVPGTRICSDYACYLKHIDKSYDLYHPAPAEVRRWLDASPLYEPYGRFEAPK